MQTATYVGWSTREFGGGEDMRDGSETMEQHRYELDDQNEGEEEHEHKTDGLELQVLLGNVDLENKPGLVEQSLNGAGNKD